MFIPIISRLKKPFWSILLTSFLLTSCGYHVENDDDESVNVHTLEVPYFQGDKNGLLTDAVIQALVSSGNFNIVRTGGGLILEGKVVKDENENIGYQYDRDPTSGRRINRLIPNEGRREVSVEIALVNVHTQDIVKGPYVVTVFNDYDYVDSDSLQDTSFITGSGSRSSVLFFSMGQLDSIDGAQSSSLPPIYRRLGIKIAEGLVNLEPQVSRKNPL